MDFLTDSTALPNLHPALVHFPVALLPVAVLMDLSGVLIRSHREWLGRAATVLYALGGAATGLAFWAGRWAADSLVDLSPQQQLAVGEHHDAALLAVWVVGIVAGLRLIIGVWKGPARRGLALRVLLLPFAVAAVVLVAVAADHGGGLVFEHGVAVTAASRQTRSAELEPIPQAAADCTNGSAVDPHDRLETRADGSLTWRPVAADGEALGSILAAAPGSTLAAVRPVESGDPNEAGLPIEVAGRALLLLPGVFAAVQIEAELELIEFAGSFGLVHHVRSADEAGFFVISSDSGAGRLTTLVGGEEEVMADGAVDLGSQPLRLASFAAGGHFRGLQNGEVVVHGHRAALERGGVGLFLEGQGQIRIHSLEVTPINE